jgi:purine nucleoside permease
MFFKTLGLGVLALAAPAAAMAQPIAPKVMVITMFGAETKPWLDNLQLSEKVAVPGLAADAPEVSCNGDLCVMTTTMGFADAATSTAAVALSDKFDLSKTYFIVAGIAGIDPSKGTLGSAAWADYVVDGGLFHRIGKADAPADWTSTIVELGAKAPGEKQAWGAGTEVYEMNKAVLDAAVAASKATELADSDDAAAYRALYTQEAARAKPGVTVCTTISADTYWHGAEIATEMAAHAKTLTDGKADYCTSQMEDNATLTALKRAASAGKLDFNRVAVLRTASNFDRPHDGQGAAESLAAKSGGFGPATENAFRVGNAFAQDIVKNWDRYEAGLK